MYVPFIVTVTTTRRTKSTEKRGKCEKKFNQIHILANQHNILINYTLRSKLILYTKMTKSPKKLQRRKCNWGKDCYYTWLIVIVILGLSWPEKNNYHSNTIDDLKLVTQYIKSPIQQQNIQWWSQCQVGQLPTTSWCSKLTNSHVKLHGDDSKHVGEQLSINFTCWNI